MRHRHLQEHIKTACARLAKGDKLNFSGSVWDVTLQGCFFVFSM